MKIENVFHFAIVEKVKVIRIRIITLLTWVFDYITLYPCLVIYWVRIRKLLGKQDMTIFDVGANKGQSIRLFSIIFPRSNFYCFEPNPSIFNILRLRQNKDNVQVFNFALGEKSEFRKFYVSDFSESSSFYEPDKNSNWYKIKNRLLGKNYENSISEILVPTVSLDDFVSEKNIDKVHFIKIDVEGSEIDVLKGAQQVLKSKVCFLQIERQSTGLYADKKQEIDHLLAECGFVILFRVKHRFKSIEEIIYVKNTLILGKKIKCARRDLNP